MPKKATTPSVNHLRAWREFREMTQEELGEKVRTTGGVISLLESGERGLSHKWLMKLAPALGTTPGFLLDHHPDDLPSDILGLWSSVPEQEKPRIMRALRAMTGTDG